jgi:hypothetical protein
MTAITNETITDDMLHQLKEQMRDDSAAGKPVVATLNIAKDEDGWFGSIAGEFFHTIPGESPSDVLRRIAESLDGVQ